MKSYAKILQKFRAHDARLVELHTALLETRKALQAKNWDDTELSARGEGLHAELEQEYAAAEAALDQLRKMHAETWRARYAAHLGAGTKSTSLVELVRAWKIQSVLEAFSNPLRNFLDEFLYRPGGPVEQALALADLNESEVPLARPGESPAMFDARQWISGATFSPVEDLGEVKRQGEITAPRNAPPIPRRADEDDDGEFDKRTIW